ATFALNSAECFFRTCLIPVSPGPQAILGAGLSLNHLSSFRGPAQWAGATPPFIRSNPTLRHLRDPSGTSRRSLYYRKKTLRFRDGASRGAIFAADGGTLSDVPRVGVAGQ